MDAEGIEAMVMYTTTGLFFFGVDSLELTVALCRAFNNWAHDFCSVDPKRLIPVYTIPIIDVGLAVKEVERIALEGARAVQIPLSPWDMGLDPYWDEIYDPLWDTLQETGIPISQHVGMNSYLAQVMSYMEEQTFKDALDMRYHWQRDISDGPQYPPNRTLLYNTPVPQFRCPSEPDVEVTFTDPPSGGGKSEQSNLRAHYMAVMGAEVSCQSPAVARGRVAR